MFDDPVLYTFQMVVDPSGPSFDLYVPLEVVIGSIPLAEIAQQHGMSLPPLASKGQPPSGAPQGLYTESVMPTSFRKLQIFYRRWRVTFRIVTYVTNRHTITSIDETYLKRMHHLLYAIYDKGIYICDDILLLKTHMRTHAGKRTWTCTHARTHTDPKYGWVTV